MKSTLILISILLLGINPIFAGNIEASFHNGTPFLRNDVLLINDTCIFKLEGNNSSQQKYTWSLNIDKKDGNLYEVKREDNGLPYFTIIIDPATYQNRLRNEEFKQTICKNDSSVYYTGNITCSINGNLVDEFPIRINLLPSIPKISEVKLIYHGYDMDRHLFLGDTLSLSFYGTRADQLYILFTAYVPDDKYFFDFTAYGGSLNYEENKHNILIPGFYFEEYYTIFTRNPYGDVNSKDTILTTDYIYDPIILKDLNDYWYPTSIDNNKTEIDHRYFYYDSQSECLHINKDVSNIKNIKIFDLNGKCHKDIDEITNKINISDISDGPYIVVCSTDTKQILIIKILK